MVCRVWFWVVAGGLEAAKAALRAAHSKTWRSFDGSFGRANARCDFMLESGRSEMAWGGARFAGFRFGWWRTGWRRRKRRFARRTPKPGGVLMAPLGLQTGAAASVLGYADSGYSMAACPASSIVAAGNLFCDGGYLRQGTLFPRKRPAGRGPARIAEVSGRVRLAFGGLGGVLKSLSLCGAFPKRFVRCRSLSQMLNELHMKTSVWANKLDKTPGRKVWFNYWETRLTHQRSYLSRLNYVHQNAVRHGLVPVARQYPWCSASWFERNTSPAKVKAIYRFKTDRVHVEDDYRPEGEWQ
jgi:hypothetical protein